MSALDTARDRDETPPRPLWSLAALSVALLLVLLAWVPFEARLIDGVPVTAKPLKFALSFGVLFATLAMVESRLSARVTEGRILNGTVLAMGAAFTAEMAYITLMAARGEPSHFNSSTPLHTFMYQSVMGAGALILVLGVAIVGVLAWRDDGARLTPALRRGIGMGFLISFGATLVTAGYMSNFGRLVGEPAHGLTLPLAGWSTEVGDLRPAHFLSLHAMQVLPLLGLWLDRRGTASALRIVDAAALAYLAVTAAVFAQALMGVPMIRL
ncbi:hypothetical protein [Roseisalinus antarcticus]|uniref:Uncharacterized protein n=1 Tax=Roseisalinus antarcticus TaxID=254357 RepID=A0A1Y5TU56_9RHOB|nr:hypothetical protein [Roseisalinus antarcticus]SLN72521.1 hypothetical protein ROA7023_03616 [Roseisalinus antarcticus]